MPLRRISEIAREMRLSSKSTAQTCPHDLPPFHHGTPVVAVSPTLAVQLYVHARFSPSRSATYGIRIQSLLLQVLSDDLRLLPFESHLAPNGFSRLRISMGAVSTVVMSSAADTSSIVELRVLVAVTTAPKVADVI